MKKFYLLLIAKLITSFISSPLHKTIALWLVKDFSFCFGIFSPLANSTQYFPSKINMKRVFFLVSFLFFMGLGNLYAQWWTQFGADIDGEATADQSGYSVSLSADGQRVAIGAPFNDDGGYIGLDVGHVRVYEENEGAWTQVGSDINGTSLLRYSGWSVSLSADGRRLAIGIPEVGTVQVYEESGGSWMQLGGNIKGPPGFDDFGISVSLSADGTYLAIGAPPKNFSYPGGEPGYVQVYEESGGVWTQLGDDIVGEAGNDFSGFSVSISADGTRLAIGAPYNNVFIGHVRVYEVSGGSWNQLGEDIDGDLGGGSSLFGWSVSLSADGNRLAIGAPDQEASHVRVYEESGGAWTQLGNDLDGESGHNVSMSADGSRLAIGNPVNVYSISGGIWSHLYGTINFGATVSISADGNRLAIGSPYGTGTVRVFDETPCPDVDQDGFTNAACSGGTDCDDNNSSINPTATEICNDKDDDCDGILDEGFADTDSDNYPDCLDWDDDNDGCPDSNDGNPLIASIDVDSDGYSEDCDDCPFDPYNDADGDGLCSDVDYDDDNDGISDSLDPCPNDLFNDSDGDGICGNVDYCPDDPYNDADGDGICADVDNDDDNDGTDDSFDPCPNDPFNDNDGDAICGDVDSDDDNDGTDDALDPCPHDPNNDIDADGICGDVDLCPYDSNNDSPDYDGLCGDVDPDDDNDGINDSVDACPNDPNNDTDGDDICGDEDPCPNDYLNDVDGDGLCANWDPCPNDYYNDVDGDYLCADDDTDDDEDGIEDEDDNCPNTVNPGQEDNDGDGVGDVCDDNNNNNDIDGDDVDDEDDNCPNDANPDQENNDGDGAGDACDGDDDNDGIVDDCDSEPLVDNYTFTGFENLPASWICGNNNDKVLVCHNPIGNSNTLCIASSAVPAHVAHGDYLGPCVPCGGQNFNIPIDTGGFDEMNEHQELEIFPNPAGDQVQLDYAGEINEIRLFSAQKKIYASGADQDLHQINLEQLPSGLYIVMVRSGNIWLTKKFVKL
jgi:hypothetical protein